VKDLIKKILIEQTENTALVVFGGINYATPEWMESQMPTDMINDNTIIKSFDTNIDEVIDELNELEYNDLQVVGFSAGGYNVFKLAKKVDIDFLGLIDPAIPTDWSLDGFPSGNNSILFFNNDNWGGYPGIKERQEDLAEEMEDKGMKVVEEDLNHKDFPTVFFEIYI
tara:strand:- start:20 stop:523 length:504 start_codon:yes stop_codon:yes gene_type:complete